MCDVSRSYIGSDKLASRETNVGLTPEFYSIDFHLPPTPECSVAEHLFLQTPVFGYDSFEGTQYAIV
jgi:hypothetical protein